MKLCVIADCTNATFARGMCSKHYSRLRRHGDPLWTPPVSRCSIEGCTRAHASKGFCMTHWKRWRKWGDPEFVLEPLRNAPLIDRWLAKVEVDHQSGCWIWRASRDGHGYGMFHIGPRTMGRTTHIVRAHRFGYEHFIGAIEDGLELDHLCKQKSCVNPHHLEPVTHAENMFRSRRETCSRGHANEWIQSTKQRYCSACRREREAG